MGVLLIFIAAVFIFRKPEDRFIGTYVDWNNKTKAIELKEDGTFKSNFTIENTRSGKWKLIAGNEVYFIELSKKDNSQIVDLLIIEEPGLVKLRFVSSIPPYSTKFELKKL